MAGDWIPRCKGLNRKPEVLWMARLTGRDRRVVADLLMDFWEWADGETADGLLRGVSLEQLSAFNADTDLAFWRALVTVGWLRESDEGLLLPNFNRWLGRNAKRRLKETQRKREERVGPRPHSVRTKSGPQDRTVLGDESPKTPLARSRPTPASGRPATHCGEPTSPPGPDEDPVILVFPAVGAGPKEWGLRRSKLAEWVEAFPAVDVPAECRRALQWLRDNPARGKTARGMTQFVSSWLGREQNRGGNRANGANGNGRGPVGPSSRVRDSGGLYANLGTTTGPRDGKTTGGSDQAAAPPGPRGAGPGAG